MTTVDNQLVLDTIEALLAHFDANPVVEFKELNRAEEKDEQDIALATVLKVLRKMKVVADSLDFIAFAVSMGEVEFSNSVRHIKGTLLKENYTNRLMFVDSMVGRDQATEFANAIRSIGARLSDKKFGSFQPSPFSLNFNSSGLSIAPFFGFKGTITLKSGNLVTPVNEGFNKFFIPKTNLTKDFYIKVMHQVEFVTFKWDKKLKKAVNPKIVDFTGNFAMKMAFIHKFGINLEGLDDGMKLVVRIIKEKKDTGAWVTKCATIPHPGVMLPELYEGCGVVDPEKSAEGFVSVYNTYPGLAKKNQDGSYTSVEGAKKFVARQVKLNKDRPDAFKTMVNLMFIQDAPEQILNAFNTGCVYMPETWIRKHGFARVVSNVGNGLIKGATHVASILDSVQGKTLGFVAASSFKGGANTLLRATGLFNTNSVVDGNVVLPTDFWEDHQINGVTVKARIIEVEIMITNPYTVERFYAPSDLELSDTWIGNQLDVLEKHLKLNKFSAKDTEMSLEILNEVEDSLVEVINDRLTKKSLVAKLPVTTVVSSEFLTIEMSYGTKIAEEYMAALGNNTFNKAGSPLSGKKNMGIQFLSGCMNTVDRIDIYKAVEILKDLGSEHDIEWGCGSKFTSVNREFLLDVVDYLGLHVNNKNSWVELYMETENGTLSVHLPTGKHFYGDLLDTSNVLDTVVTSGVLPKFLEKMDYVCASRGVPSVSSLAQTIRNLNLEVQWKFVNKAFGRLVTTGNYFTLLPGFWLENEYDVCLPARDFVLPKSKGKKYVKANLAKHPILFLEAASGCHVYKDIPGVDIDDEMRLLMRPVVFVHPMYLLKLQNDCDGDLARVTFDSYTLPLFSKAKLNVSNCVSSKFHEKYIAKESDVAVKGSQAIKTWSASELHLALQDAAVSKEKVATFTELFHKVCTYTRLDEDGIQARIITGQMIQECAMNAIKHNSKDGDTVADLLNRIGKKSCPPIEVIVAALVEYFNEYDFTIADKEGYAKTLCQLVENASNASEYVDYRKCFKDCPVMGNEFVELKGAFPISQYAEAETDFFGDLLRLFSANTVTVA